ncbi:MAG: alpha/beta hydrolase [Fibrobacteria bacterium]|nr:alpha/beta hydrolase [Fibrobacteria bacterium]
MSRGVPRRGNHRKGWVASVLLGGLVGLYVVYGGTLFAVQRSLVFPGKVNPRSPDSLTRWIETPDATVEMRWFPAPADSQGWTGMFFHGNAEVVDDWPLSVEQWNRRGVSVLLVEYPGYGNSRGKGPSQERIRQVAEAAYDWVVTQPEVQSNRVFAAGRSLGGGVACDLSTTRPLAGLFLQSTFASVRRTGSRRYKVPGFLVRDPFDNLSALAAFQGPVLAMHGTQDGTIDFGDLDQIRAAQPRMRAVVFQGHGHSTLPGPDTTLYWSEIDSFLVRIRDR